MTAVYIDPERSSENIVVLTKSAIMFADLAKDAVADAAQRIRDGAHVIEILGSDCISIPYSRISKLVNRNTEDSLDIDHGDDFTSLSLFTEKAAQEALQFLDPLLPESFKRTTVQQSALIAGLPAVLTAIGAGAISYWTYELKNIVAIIAGLVCLVALFVAWGRLSTPPVVTTFSAGKSVYKHLKSMFLNIIWLGVVAVGVGAAYENHRDSSGPAALINYWNTSDSFTPADVQRFIERGADINYVSEEYGQTVLMNLAYSDDPSVIEALIDAGADVNGRDEYGTSVLHMAVDNLALSNARILLEAGADPNSKDDSGYTPLVQAVSSEHAAMVELLLAYKANADWQGPDGESLSDLTENEEVLALLID